MEEVFRLLELVWIFQVQTRRRCGWVQVCLLEVGQSGKPEELELSSMHSTLVHRQRNLGLLGASPLLTLGNHFCPKAVKLAAWYCMVGEYICKGEKSVRFKELKVSDRMPREGREVASLLLSRSLTAPKTIFGLSPLF